MPRDQRICWLCAKPKMVAVQTGISVCPRCDVAGSLIWPNDYVEWTPGDPFPGAVE